MTDILTKNMARRIASESYNTQTQEDIMSSRVMARNISAKLHINGAKHSAPGRQGEGVIWLKGGSSTLYSRAPFDLVI